MDFSVVRHRRGLLKYAAWEYHMLLACPEQPNHLPVFFEYRKSFKDNWYVVLRQIKIEVIVLNI